MDEAVRRATREDIAALTDVLARAFLDDPIAEWSCRPDRLRDGVLKSFHGARLRQLVAHEEVWTVPSLASAALWSPPGAWRTTPREDLALASGMLHARLLPRAPLVVAGLLGFEAHHPREPPHWYLAVLGTDPPAQHRGLASAALAPVLERCDQDGVGAFLETGKERNIDFYARHGFVVMRERRLPRGPRYWQMWRNPLGYRAAPRPATA